MKVTGFTFIRNGIKYDYPYIEAIKSILPICDEFIVAVGNSDDGTRESILGIDPKIKIIDTIWDDSLREGGKVLAVETDKAFKAVAEDSDWAFYIQGDEVVHEKYLPIIKEEMLKHKDNLKVDGLLLDYLHFYGSYDYVGAAHNWYRKEVRVIRSSKNIHSYKDAQGFRKDDNQKLNVKAIKASMFHYGWVKEPKAMQGKQETFHKLWHSDNWLDKNVVKTDAFDYSVIDALYPFKETHPKVMKDRITSKNWKFDFDISMNKLNFIDKLKDFIEKITGKRLGEYKNYKEV
jgi:hypothetical protein